MPFQEQDNLQDEVQKKGMFAKQDQQAPPSFVEDLSNDVNSLGSRMRLMEERYINLRRKIQVNEQNSLVDKKKLFGDVKAINEELNEIKQEMAEIKDKITLVVKELQLFAKKEDVELVNKYMELWEPVKFVTQSQVEKIVRRVLEEEK